MEEQFQYKYVLYSSMLVAVEETMPPWLTTSEAKCSPALTQSLVISNVHSEGCQLAVLLSFSIPIFLLVQLLIAEKNIKEQGSMVKIKINKFPLMRPAIRVVKGEPKSFAAMTRTK
jgi:hypothetical protein